MRSWRMMILALTLGLSIPAVVGWQEAVAQAKTAKKKTKKVRRKKRKKRKKRQRWPTRRPQDGIGMPPKLGDIPFPEGERLAYKIKMLNADAGECILAVGNRTKFEGRSVVPLAGFLRSSEFLSKFYPIEDRIYTLVDEKTFSPIKTEFFIRENGKSIDYFTEFKQAARHIISKREKKGKTLNRDFTTADNIFESLSSVYAARRVKMSPGMSFKYYVWDGRRERLVTIKVVGPDKVWTPMGTFDATKVEVSSVITGGFIKKKVLDEDAKLGTVWFGTDAHRTPLKVLTPTKLGNAEAVLVKRYIEKGDLKPIAPEAVK